MISRKALRQFWERHPESKQPLLRWYRIVSKTQFESFAALRETFPSVDKVGKFVVFNIGGNKYRLIAVMHFNRRRVYVRQVLTHREYDEGKWQ